MVRPPTDPILGIVPADPSLRRVALLAWGSLAVFGAIAIWYAMHVLRAAEAMAVYDPRGAFLAVQRIVIPMVIGAAVLGVAAAVYCLVNALRVFRAGRFPAPGARLLRATPIRRGPEARRIGIAMAALALVMLAASVAMPVFLQRVIRAVDQSDHRFRATPPEMAPPAAGEGSSPKG
jgi:hypothetical protein